MCLICYKSRTHYNKINIHIGGAYGDKPKSMERFCKNFERLPNRVKSRLTVENDDKQSMYSVKELYHGVYSNTCAHCVRLPSPPFLMAGLVNKSALELAISTWLKVQMRQLSIIWRVVVQRNNLTRR